MTTNIKWRQKLWRNTRVQLLFWVLIIIALIVAWFSDAFTIVHDIKGWFGK
jgi:hypothetical protein